MDCSPVPRLAGRMELPAAFQDEALDLPQVLCHVLPLDVRPHLIERHDGGTGYLQQVLRRFQRVRWWRCPAARWQWARVGSLAAAAAAGRPFCCCWCVFAGRRWL